MSAQIAYCVECGAKHEIEGWESCMCGGRLDPDAAPEGGD